MLSTDVMQCALLSYYVKFQVEFIAKGCFNPNYDYKKGEAAAAEILMNFSEEERFGAIVAFMLPKNQVMALGIAKLCLEEKYLRIIVRQSFPYLDWSAFRYWIPQGLLYLGQAELLTLINESYAEDPTIKGLAMRSFHLESKRDKPWLRYEEKPRLPSKKKGEGKRAKS